MKNTAKNFMFYVAFVASLGGLLFGFDTAVISGAEKSIQVVYDLSDFSHGFTIAIALIGTIIGAFVCSKPVEKHGRLKALKIIAFLYFVSAVGSAAIIDWYSFLFFRFAGGFSCRSLIRSRSHVHCRNIPLALARPFCRILPV